MSSIMPCTQRVFSKMKFGKHSKIDWLKNWKLSNRIIWIEAFRIFMFHRKRTILDLILLYQTIAFTWKTLLSHFGQSFSLFHRFPFNLNIMYERVTIVVTVLFLKTSLWRMQKKYLPYTQQKSDKTKAKKKLVIGDK